MKSLALASAAALLASCGGMMQQAEMASADDDGDGDARRRARLPRRCPRRLRRLRRWRLRPMPTPGIAARERFQVAINALQQGDSPRAAVELRAYLAEVPNSTPARNLLTQIETPIEMLYPAESFNVQLQQSETLSSLAGIYLGDVLGFYGSPATTASRIRRACRVGQTIRIPRTPATLAAQANRASMASMQMPMPAPMPMPASCRLPRTRRRAAAGCGVGAASRRRRDPRRRAIRGYRSARTLRPGRFDAAIRDAETARVTPNGAQAVVLASAYAGNARAIQMTNATEAAAQAFRAGQLYLETANRPRMRLRRWSSR